MYEKMVGNFRTILQNMAKGGSTISNDMLIALADLLTLGHEISDEILDLLNDIFIYRNIYSKDEANKLVFEIRINILRLNSVQKNDLLLCIIENYSHYENLEFCWTVGDMIARSYEPDVALKTFGMLSISPSKSGSAGIMLGLDILQLNSVSERFLAEEIGRASCRERV